MSANDPGRVKTHESRACAEWHTAEFSHSLDPKRIFLAGIRLGASCGPCSNEHDPDCLRTNRYRPGSRWAHPDRNVTGVCLIAPELEVKGLSLLREALSSVHRIAVLSNHRAWASAEAGLELVSAFLHSYDVAPGSFSRSGREFAVGYESDTDPARCPRTGIILTRMVSRNTKWWKSAAITWREINARRDQTKKT